MNMRFWMTLFTITVLPGLAFADDWKDESGKGRGGPPPWAGKGGEPPDWARGKGVWDGHFKRGGPPVYAPDMLRPPIWSDHRFYPQDAPPVPYAPGWVGDPEDYRERLKDMREREREALLERQEQRRELNQELREREREAYQEWREWQRERGPYPSPPLRYPAAPWR